MRTRSIVEYTQVWWSVRPHFAFGTVEVRICDAQATAGESDALASLMVACVAQAARDVDEGRPFDDPPPRLIEENMWRAIRYGLDGRLIDLETAAEYPAAEVAERLAEWTEPVRAELGVDIVWPERNGAQRQRAHDRGGRQSRGGLRGLGATRPRDLFTGGDGVSADDDARRCRHEHAGSRPRRSCAPPTKPSSSRITSRRDDAADGRLAAQPRRAAGSAWRPARRTERDLEQVRDAIDAVRALLPVLERQRPPQELGPIRDAL